MKNNVVCIAGMHRSGTSLLSSWLSSCGLITNNGSIVDPGVGNVKGHFEDRDFVLLHESVIKSVSPESMGWKVFEERPLSFDAESRRKARDLISARDSMLRVWGWKDPRTVLFLEQWKALIPGLKVIAIWRPCREVVWSLVSRYLKAVMRIPLKRSERRIISLFKVSFAQAEKLWTVYNSLLYEYVSRFRDDAVLFSIDSLQERDLDVFNRIFSKISGDIEYREIKKIYDPNLLNRKNRVLRFIKMTDHAIEVEKKLINFTEKF